MNRLLKALGVLVLIITLASIGIAGSVAALVPGVRTIWQSSEAAPLEVGELSPLAQRSTVYAADGTEIGQLGTINRRAVPLSEVAPVMLDAVIAVEDRTFYTNPGIDLQAIGRALIKNISSGSVEQGGSTITQQLVKNRILTTERSLDRKVKEAAIAWRLNQEYSKNEILEQYLNTVFFGQNSYGVASASERFFGVPVQKLDLPQAALLAGVIRSPSGFNPFDHPNAAKSRRAEVLVLMREQGYITEAQQRAADAAPMPTQPPPPDLRPTSYFVQEVQARLLDDTRLGATEGERANKVLRGGLRIYTTFDAATAEVAHNAIVSTIPNRPPFTAALASIDPTNGHVRALAQGQDYSASKYDLTTHYPGRQPGSTYKVIVLAAALEAGYSINDTISGSSPCTVERDGYQEWKTRNAEGSGGTNTLRSQLVGSVNCAFARLIGVLGPKAVIDMAHRLGITQPIGNYLSIALGTNPATPLEMATVFATLADNGVRHDPVFVTKVEGPNGQVIFEDHSSGKQVLDPEIAKTVVDAMRGVVTSGTGTRARLDDGRVAAGKTGSTDNRSDAWFCGFVPQLATCVWMGDPSQLTPMRNVGGVNVFGGTYPAEIFKRYMDTILVGQPNLPFDPPNRSLWPRGRYISDRGRGKEESRSSSNPTTTTTTVATTVPAPTPPTPPTPPAVPSPPGPPVP